MIPVVVLQPSSSFPSGHDQGGGEVVVTNLFTMDFVLVVIVRRWWEGWSLVKLDLSSRNVCSWCLWWWFHLLAFFYIPGSNSNDFRAIVIMRSVLKSQHNISVFKSTQWRDQKIPQYRDWDFSKTELFWVFASLDRKMRWPDRDSGRVPFLLSGGQEEPVTYW